MNNARNDNLTQETGESVEAFLASVDHAGRVADCRVVMDMMAQVTGLPPKMWGASLIGFGRYHYRYDSGREGDFLWWVSAQEKPIWCATSCQGLRHFLN